MKSAHDKRIGRPQQREAQALIARILETAARLFKEQGYAATSIEQIASLSGSGKQTIYRRFSTRERSSTGTPDPWAALGDPFGKNGAALAQKPLADAKLSVGRKIPQRIGRLAVDADLEIQRADLMRPRAHVGDDLPHRYRLTFMHQ